MVRIFNLAGVSEEEAEAMRQALKEADVDFYETPDSKWGFGSPGLWVRDATLEGRARAAIDAAQENWVAMYGVGSGEPGAGRASRWSIRYLFFVLLAAAVLALSLALPWWAFS